MQQEPREAAGYWWGHGFMQSGDFGWALKAIGVCQGRSGKGMSQCVLVLKVWGMGKSQVSEVVSQGW